MEKPPKLMQIFSKGKNFKPFLFMWVVLYNIFFISVLYANGFLTPYDSLYNALISKNVLVLGASLNIIIIASFVFFHRECRHHCEGVRAVRRKKRR